MLTDWVQARRQPHRDAAGPAARRPARAHRRTRRRSRTRTCRSTPAQRAGAGHRRRRRSSSTARPTATRWPARPRSRRSTTRADCDVESRRSRCAASGRTAVRPRRSPTTSRGRSSTRARATPPGPARSATGSRHPLRRPVLRQLGRSRLGRPDKVAIPQADEQQRLLANLIVHMNADRKPLPRFWYFPRGEKAAVVMTGDDHGSGGTAGRFEQLQASESGGLLGRRLGVRPQRRRTSTRAAR